MKKIKSNFASNNEIKKLITKYNSKYYLKLVNNVYSSKYEQDNDYIIINGIQWPKKIYYDDSPPILNNIIPSKYGNKYIYNISSNTIGIQLDSPRYDIIEIDNKYTSGEICEIKNDIRLLINIVANMK
jgi:hypothetical protein